MTNSQFNATNRLAQACPSTLLVLLLFSALAGVALGQGMPSALFPGQSFWTQYTVEGIAYGDFDLDGDIDIAVSAFFPNEIWIFTNRGNGYFDGPTATYPVGVGGGGLTVTDLGDDGDLDLILRDWPENTMSILMNRGDGTFEAEVLHTSGAVRSGPIIDLNTDGYPDLVQSIKAGTLGVSFGNSSGLFDEAVEITIPHGFTGNMVYADYNGDGFPDIAAAHTESGGNFGFIINAGDGTFPTSVLFPKTFKCDSLTQADLNGDTHADLILVEDDFQKSAARVVLSDGKGGFTEPAMYPAGGWIYRQPRIGDINEDGMMDLLIPTEFRYGLNNRITDELVVFLNNGEGFFYPGEPLAHTPNPGIVELCDINNDNHLDIVSGFSYKHNNANGVSIVFGNGDGSFLLPLEYEAGNQPRGVVTADLNLDGFPDAAACSFGDNEIRVWMNQGDGTLGEPAVYTAPNGPSALTPADLDGDGDTDIVSVNFRGDSVRVWMNQGDGLLTDGEELPVGEEPYQVIVADFDNDGDLDLVTADYKSRTISLLRNVGDGTYPKSVIAYYLGDLVTSVAHGDFDSDGDIDLAACLYQRDTIAILFNDGIGNYSNRIEYHVGESPRAIITRDMDGDSNLDLVVANYSLEENILYGDGEGGFTVSMIPTAGLGAADVVATDIDNDGDMDLAFANYYENTLGVLLNDGGRTFTMGGEYAVEEEPRSIAAADFDQDGDIDILLTHYEVGLLSIMPNQLHPVTCVADLQSDGVLDIFDVFAFLNAFKAGNPTADFTGDGILDIFDIFAFLDAFNAGCT